MCICSRHIFITYVATSVDVYSQFAFILYRYKPATQRVPSLLSKSNSPFYWPPQKKENIESVSKDKFSWKVKTGKTESEFCFAQTKEMCPPSFVPWHPLLEGLGT